MVRESRIVTDLGVETVLTGNNSTRKSVTTVQPHSVPASGTIDLNLARIRGEALGRVLGGDAALEGKTTGRNVVLCEAELLERRTGGDLDLGSHDVDARDLLSDGMLDLAEHGRVSTAAWPTWLAVTYIRGLISIK